MKKNYSELFTFVLDDSTSIIGELDLQNSSEESLYILRPVLVKSNTIFDGNNLIKSFEVRPLNLFSNEKSLPLNLSRVLTVSRTNIEGKIMYLKCVLGELEEKKEKYILNKDACSQEFLKDIGIVRKDKIIDSLNKMIKN